MVMLVAEPKSLLTSISGRKQKVRCHSASKNWTLFDIDAQHGEDTTFRKGSTTYQCYLGDAENKPNPCLRPLQAPFYAVEIFPGDIGTSMGLDITKRGKVKDRDGQVIPGLYACGNDINSIMSGSYPGPGITLGPALTFGYIVGESAAA